MSKICLVPYQNQENQFHQVLALLGAGAPIWIIAAREYTMKYCPLRKGNTENQLFQYYPLYDYTKKIVYIFMKIVYCPYKDLTQDIQSNIAFENSLRQKAFTPLPCWTF